MMLDLETPTRSRRSARGTVFSGPPTIVLDIGTRISQRGAQGPNNRIFPTDPRKASIRIEGSGCKRKIKAPPGRQKQHSMRVIMPAGRGPYTSFRSASLIGMERLSGAPLFHAQLSRRAVNSARSGVKRGKFT